MKKEISRNVLSKAKYRSTESIYNPAADFKWIQTQSKLPWLQLDISIPYNEILNEINLSPVEYVEHRDDYDEHAGWLSGCLHGRSWSATREESHYNDTSPFGWTNEACQHFPFTVDYFKNQWPATNFQRLRIMLLEPGGYIALHRDYQDQKLSAINIAITNPKECCFGFAEHGIVPFEPGSAFWLDISNYHTVFNDSNQPRWHIIVHQDLGDIRFQELVVKSYHIMYNKEI